MSSTLKLVIQDWNQEIAQRSVSNQSPLILQYTCPDSQYRPPENTTGYSIDGYGWCPLLVEVELSDNGGQGPRCYFARGNLNNSTYILLSTPSQDYSVDVLDTGYNHIGVYVTSSYNYRIAEIRCYNWIYLVPADSPTLVTLSSSLATTYYGPGAIMTYPQGTEGARKHLMSIPFDPDEQAVYLTTSTDNAACIETIDQGHGGSFCSYAVLGRVHSHSTEADYDEWDDPLTESTRTYILMDRTEDEVYGVEGIAYNYSDEKLNWNKNHYVLLYSVDDETVYQHIINQYSTSTGKWGNNATSSSIVHGGLSSYSNESTSFFAITFAPWVYWNGSDFTYD